MVRGEQLYACHCEKRSDEAIQLDCDECAASADAARFADFAMTNSDVQQRSEESTCGMQAKVWILHFVQNDKQGAQQQRNESTRTSTSSVRCRVTRHPACATRAFQWS